MQPFWKRQAPPAANLEAMLLRLTAAEAEVAKLASEVRAYQTEVIEVQDRVQKWMRRVTAEARAGDREIVASEPGVSNPPPRPRSLWGARGRRAARLARAAEAAVADTNGGGD